MSPTRAVVYGGLTVGLLDGLDAVVFFGLRGVSPVRIFQGIAAGLLGRASFDGGAATFALGLAIHFTIATSIAATFYLLSRRFPDLARRPFLWGPPYGVGVYLFMNLVVIPLSMITPRTPPVLVVVNGVLIHIFGVGIPSAWFTHLAWRGTAARG